MTIYPSEVLDKLFDTKMTVVKCIIAAEGDNAYKMPNKKKVVGYSVLYVLRINHIQPRCTRITP